jgi:hypothetical protein
MQTNTPYCHTLELPQSEQDIALKHEPICEVILHNDDVNAMEHVVASLINVFGHARQLAEHISGVALLRKLSPIRRPYPIVISSINAGYAPR